MSEYYFEYQVKPLSDPLRVCENENGLPRLYLERDYKDENVKYMLYMVIPQWDALPKGERRSAPFDIVSLSYDVRGISTEVFEANERIEIKNRRVDREEYERTHGFRLPFGLEDENDYSGVGRIILLNSKTQEKSVLYFAVNFAFKKKIHYWIKNERLTIECRDIRDSIKLRLCYLADRYPCLRSDRDSSNQGRSILLHPDPSGKKVISLEQFGGKTLYLTFDSTEREAEKYYLLECRENDTLDVAKRDFVRPEQKLFCPYCHEEINPTASFESGYRKGGIACNGERLENDGKPLVILDGKSRNKPAKNTLYCGDDFGIAQGGKRKSARDFNANTAAFARVLPEDFLRHSHFKVAVVGSKRAGKTTFISRMFDITGQGNNTELASKMMTNATRSLCSLVPYSLKRLEIGADAWHLGRNPWYKNNEFYSQYSIDIGLGHYPKPTDKVNEDALEQKKNIFKYPFVYEVDRRDYVYFYDIAGEDAEQSGNRLTRVMANAPTGIFYLVDGRSNEAGNDRVLLRITETIRENKLNCPIAVILTKFDMLENEFDPNCHCLRSDVFDLIGDSYEGSLLEEHIDLASEEIHAYLLKHRINPNFGEGANVRYFGVSSFSANDAVFHQDQRAGSAEVNYLKHSCSAKRMELPLLWMLKQFGCIV